MCVSTDAGRAGIIRLRRSHRLSPYSAPLLDEHAVCCWARREALGESARRARALVSQTSCFPPPASRTSTRGVAACQRVRHTGGAWAACMLGREARCASRALGAGSRGRKKVQPVRPPATATPAMTAGRPMHSTMYGYVAVGGAQLSMVRRGYNAEDIWTHAAETVEWDGDDIVLGLVALV